MKKKLKLILFPLLSIIVVFALWITWHLTFSNNIYAVIPGQAYRSARLSPQRLNALIKTKKIKSIINIEGHHKKQWYVDETAVAKQHDVKYYNARVDAHKVPSQAQLERLVNALDNAPRPTLLHCRHGIDRSGFASAIVRILSGDPSLKNAEKQFSMRYFEFQTNTIGQRVFPMYERWLVQHKLPNSRNNFLTWVDQFSL